MKSALEYKWIRNTRDSLYCGLVLSRAIASKDIRLYVQRYMYDQVYLIDEIFHSIRTWSTLQKNIYNSMLTSQHSAFYLNPSCGATTVIAGMVLSLTICGKKSIVVTKSVNDQRKFMKMVGDMLILIRYYDDQKQPLLSARNSETIEFQNGGAIKCVPKHWIECRVGWYDWDVLIIDGADVDITTKFNNFVKVDLKIKKE
jgi:hypothetical protein